jgi:ParB-like chromosome segregation protein Spo0J
MVRVVLRPRFGGGYNIEDGRHRVIAAKQAGIAFIEAKLVG